MKKIRKEENKKTLIIIMIKQNKMTTATKTVKKKKKIKIKETRSSKGDKTVPILKCKHVRKVHNCISCVGRTDADLQSYRKCLAATDYKTNIINGKKKKTI